MSLWFQPLKKYADFSGRATREEYWGFTFLSFLITVAAIMVAGGIMGATGGFADGQHSPAGYMVGGTTVVGLALYYLAIIIPSLAVLFRRLHDTDRSAVWILIAFIPFGGLVLLVFTVLDGTSGPNRHGEDPKGRTPTGGSGGETVREVHHHHHYNASPPPSPSTGPIVS